MDEVASIGEQDIAEAVRLQVFRVECLSQHGQGAEAKNDR
jgi:hypothetical protein